MSVLKIQPLTKRPKTEVTLNDSSFGHPTQHGADIGGGDAIQSTPTRIRRQAFDWRQNCFVCGKACYDNKRKTWSLVKKREQCQTNLYSTVLKAAYERQDEELISRLLGIYNGDLVTVQARYHRIKNCCILH